MKLLGVCLLHLTLTQPMLAVRSGTGVQSQRMCGSKEASYHYEMDILSADGKSNETVALELVVGGEEPRLVMHKNAGWAASVLENEQGVYWTPYYTEGAAREEAMKVDLRDMAYVKHAEDEVETPNGTVTIDGIEIMSNDGRTFGFEGGIYFSDELMLKAMKKDDGKYLLKRGVDVYNAQGLPADAQFHKARPCAGLIIGVGLVAGIGMAIGWGFIGGYALGLNVGAKIVGLVFSTIGMGVVPAALVMAIGFGIAYLIYQHTNMKRYSATHHMWSELQCVGSLTMCRDKKSLVPEGGDCDVPGPKRCCCTADDPSTCKIMQTSELKSSRNIFQWNRLVCPSSEKYRHFNRYHFEAIPSTCVASDGVTPSS